MKIEFSKIYGIQTQMLKTQNAITKSIERLSSGLRVNSPKDDSATFSAATQIGSDAKGLMIGIQNMNLALGAVHTADQAMASQLDILTRMREVAVQGGNSSLTETDRQGLNAELTALLAEYERLQTATEFNGQRLLDGSFVNKNIQLGHNLENSLNLSINSLDGGDIFTRVVGNGTFASSVTSSAGAGAYAVYAADINNDGKMDAISVDNTDATVSIFIGNGDGTFNTRTTLATGTNVRSLVVKDVNNDGLNDIVTLEPGSVSVFLGNGDGTFDARVTQAVGATTVGDLDIADINGDGFLDIATADSNDNTISILLGNGDGTFKTRTTLSNAGTPRSAKFGDMDGDGDVDLVTTAGNNVYIFTNDGHGNFNAGTSYATGTTATGLALGDLDGDGDLDVVTSNQGGGTGSVSVLLNQGAGVLGTATTTSMGANTNPERVRLADINSDDILDIITADQNANTLSLFTGKGNGTFNSRTTLSTATSPRDVRLADFNGDGVLDILTANSGANTIGLHLANAYHRNAVSDIDVDSVLHAERLIDIIDTALDRIQEERSSVNSVQSRLTLAADSNLLLAENLKAASDQMLAADIAAETAIYTYNQILQQSQIATLAQANLQMQAVLRLLEF